MTDSNPVVPSVRVDVLYHLCYIIGEVRNPGSCQCVTGMAVINAVALAGGFTYRADPPRGDPGWWSNLQAAGERDRDPAQDGRLSDQSEGLHRKSCAGRAVLLV